MYLFAKFGTNRSCGNAYFSFYIISYMNTLEKADITDALHDIERFSESGIPIYDSTVPDTPGRKTRRRTQAIAKYYAFHAKAINYNGILGK